MRNSDTNPSLLRGIDAKIDELLLPLECRIGKPPSYKSKSSMMALSKAKKPPASSIEFFEQCFESLKENHLNQSTGYQQTQSNWHLRQEIDHKSTKEVALERAFLTLGENWFNQLSTSSGLIDPHADKKRAIDLVHECSPGSFDFIELKIGSDYPLSAAVEILLYWLIYLFSRERLEELGYDNRSVFKATRVDLKVLAPREFYESQAGETIDLSWLESWFNDGVATFTSNLLGRSVATSFAFWRFGDGFVWEDNLGDSDTIQEFMKREVGEIRRVFED